MVLNDRIAAFVAVGKFLNQFKSSGYEKVNTIPQNDEFFDTMCNEISAARHYNGWFTEEQVLFSLEQWSNALTKNNLENWLNNYNIGETTPQTVGVIMAGNIPLVGFHDFLSVLITGNKVLAKLSSSDHKLLPLIANYLIAIEPRFETQIKFTTEKFEGFDAIIATGSNNTARYFEHYFSKVPNVIRKNRNSVAVLTGEESKEELTALGNDIFRYYGLGCRSVSKLMVPEGYNFDAFFEAIYPFNDIINETKYANNYDYNKAVYLMSNFKLLENGFLMLKEDESYSSPIATVFYETYTDSTTLQEKLNADRDKIQCIVSKNGFEENINFGNTQSPGLSDYADGVDIIEFLLKIN